MREKEGLRGPRITRNRLDEAGQNLTLQGHILCSQQRPLLVIQRLK
jgi:hypothetical protein